MFTHSGCYVKHLGFQSCVSMFRKALTCEGGCFACQGWMAEAFSVSAEHMVLIIRTAHSSVLAVTKRQRERIMMFLNPITL